jgi:hypothetical protein
MFSQRKVGKLKKYKLNYAKGFETKNLSKFAVFDMR